MNIIMLGAPGAGKGTISSRLENKYNLPHISSGDIFRYNIKNKTELGIKVQSYIEKGLLVPDEITINMMIDRISQDDCQKGFIMDGFPRNPIQAKAFDEALAKSHKDIDTVILVAGDLEKIAKRLSGRRVCENCGEAYHIVSLKPKVDGVCDKCGGKLVQRKDDTEEVIWQRFDTYKSETEPLIEYYKNKNVLHTVDGFASIEDSIEQISKIL